jgi:rRNA maturation endonuclease Nob1
MTNIPTERYIQESEEYVCQVCDTSFFRLPSEKLICPKCGTDDPDSLELQAVVKKEDDVS